MRDPKELKAAEVRTAKV